MMPATIARFVFSSALLAFAASALQAQTIGAARSALDCVMEPKSTIDLASPEEGVINELLVDRGDLVKENQVVARLDMRLESLGGGARVTDCLRDSGGDGLGLCR